MVYFCAAKKSWHGQDKHRGVESRQCGSSSLGSYPPKGGHRFGKGDVKKYIAGWSPANAGVARWAHIRQGADTGSRREK